MKLYDKYVLPKVTNYLCSNGPVNKQRQKIVPLAHGDILEIGFGSGLNLPHYDKSKVDIILALDPSVEMWNLAKEEIERQQMPVEFVKGGAENIPLQGHSIDTVLLTYTLCSIPDLVNSMSEIRRVLKPGGQLLFCEHGKAPDRSVEKWQRLLNPAWRTLGGGCNLTRDIPEIISNGGFKFEWLQTMYIPGFRPACYNYWGSAKAS
jgi:ubiquinone/menaquinone biosynthesis C-methylase UbiE